MGRGCFREKNIRSPEENTCIAGYSSTQSICSSFFSSCCTVSSAGGKDAIVVVKKDEGAGQKINANNESVAPKKRKSRQDAKENIRLDLLFVVCISMSKVILEVEYSQTSRKRPPKLQRLSDRLRPFGRWSLTESNHRGPLPRKVTPCVAPCCY